MQLRDELMRRKNVADKAEAEMWRTLSEPDGTEPYQAWKAALAFLDEMHEILKASWATCWPSSKVPIGISPMPWIR
jgi:hypothetical protein